MQKTTNFAWSINDFLGSGAQGDVFTGYNINTGEAVAVKVMRNISNIPRDQLKHLLSLQERELEVLRRLDHPNIVKLIGVEDENEHGTTQRKIIIMQLCTGGCLNDLLANPESKFGFDDAEFINVLKGITAGMEKLHSENIVHRDIKPLNIMKYIGEDGRSIYKLIDFGAARELAANQEFESVYGTEEYLHPRVYRRAFGFETNEEANQLFDNRIDLWSIGATLYHVATGSLPFRSYAGRKDRTIMFRIIAGKQSGHISGEQNSRDSEIVYNNHLPANCLMSKGLRPAVERLLARLLESDEGIIVSFEDFFEMANNIIRKKIVAVFDCGTTDVLKVYMDPSGRFEVFQTLLSEQVNVQPANQLLLYENINFAQYFGGDEQGLLCREIVESNPVYLFYECFVIDHLNLDVNEYKIPSRQEEVDSVTFSQLCCQSLHFIKRNVIKSQLRQRLIDSGAVMLIRFLSTKWDKFLVKMEHLTDNIPLLSDKIKTSLQLIEFAERMDHQLLNQSNVCMEMVMEKTRNLQELSEQLKTKLQGVKNDWGVEKPSCKEDDCCTSRIEFLVKTVDDIHKELQQNNQLDDTKRKLKCHKLEYCCVSAKSLIEDHCQENAKQLIDLFQEFLIQIWPNNLDLEKLEKDLENHAQLLKQKKEWSEQQTVNLNLPDVSSVFAYFNFYTRQNNLNLLPDIRPQIPDNHLPPAVDYQIGETTTTRTIYSRITTLKLHFILISVFLSLNLCLYLPDYHLLSFIIMSSICISLYLSPYHLLFFFGLSYLFYPLSLSPFSFRFLSLSLVFYYSFTTRGLFLRSFYFLVFLFFSLLLPHDISDYVSFFPFFLSVFVITSYILSFFLSFFNYCFYLIDK